MATAHWLVDGQSLLPYPVAPERTHNQWHTPNSYAFCCPECGDVWARRTIIDDVGKPQRWFFWSILCKRCHGGLLIPGSLLLWGDHEYFRNLPSELLKREFLLQWEHTNASTIRNP